MDTDREGGREKRRKERRHRNRVKTLKSPVYGAQYRNMAAHPKPPDKSVITGYI